MKVTVVLSKITLNQKIQLPMLGLPYTQVSRLIHCQSNGFLDNSPPLPRMNPYCFTQLRMRHTLPRLGLNSEPHESVNMPGYSRVNP